MSVGSNYEVGIEVNAKNVEKIIAALTSVQDLLTEISAGGKIDVSSMEALSKASDQIVAKLKESSAAAKMLTGDLGGLAAKALEAEQKFQALNLADLQAGGTGKGTGPSVLGNLPEELQDAATRVQAFRDANLPAAIKAAEAESQKLAQGFTKVDEANSKLNIQSISEELGRVAAATVRLTEAENALSVAKDKTAAAFLSGDTSAASKALSEEATARIALKDARKEDTAARAQQAAQEEKAAKQEEASTKRRVASEESLQAAQRANNYPARVEQVGRLAAAIEAVTAAQQRYADAQQASDVAASSGNQDKVSEANRHEEKSLRDLTAAEKEHESAVKQAEQIKQTARKESVATAGELEKIEKSLGQTYARIEDQSTRDSAGRRVAAREALTRTTRELVDAEKALNQAQASGDPAAIKKAAAEFTAAEGRVAKATRENTSAINEQVNSMPRLRYAMYDVARSATMLGTALLAIPLAAAGVFATLEKGFAGVIRTTQTYLDGTGAATRALKSDFEALFGSMPADWGAITRIGELSGQMNIAASDVANFTKLVTMFSTATDVSVDESATAFGRLSTLLNVSAHEYENLGSSILAVGINSVATEGQIIAISQQIAGIAGTVGMTADEVVGLSSALASIGTAPELSRGIVTRLFTNIMKTVAAGGDQLEAFAKISGTTATEFADLWGNDASQAVYKLMEGLGQLKGDKALAAMKELGITQVRDIPAVLKLSQNYEMLGESLGIAANGYEEGSLLAEQYGVATDTLVDRILILKNNFTLLLSALGEGAKFFKPLVDLLSKVVSGVTALAKTKVGAVVLGLVMLATSLVGVLLLAVAAIAGVVGSSLALKTALIQLSVQFRVAATAADAATMSTFGLVKGLIAATGASKGLGIAMKSALVSTGIGALVVGIGMLVDHLMNAKSASDELFGSMESLESAIAADTAAAKTEGAFRTLSVSIKDTARSGDEISESFAKITGISSGTANALGEVESAADRATIALGKEMAAAMTKTFLENEDMMKGLEVSADRLAEIGFSVSDYIKSTLAGEAPQYIDDLRKRLELLKQVEIGKLLETGGFAANAEIAGLEFVFNNINKLFDQLSDGSSDFDSELSKLTLSSEIFSTIMKSLGIDMDEFEDGLGGATEALKGYLALFPELDNSAAATQGSLHDLAKTFKENGSALDMYSEEGRASISALDSTLNQLWTAGGETASGFGNELANMFAYLGGAGVELGSDFDDLRGVMVNTFNQTYGLNLDISQARGSIHQFVNDAMVALRAVAALEKRQMSASAALSGSTIPAVAKMAQTYTNAFARQSAVTAQTGRELINLQTQLSKSGAAGKAAGDAINNGMNKGGGGAKKAAKDAKDLKEELYTLGDYASDLSGIWNRAFEIRFSPQQTLDAITEATRAMAERFEAAEQRVRDLRLELQRLNADLTGLKAELSLQEYFLSIAVEYGDTKRAEQIQAKIADLQADIASKQEDVTKTGKEMNKAQEDTSRTLEGNSAAAIRNRRELENLVKLNLNHLEALANTGATAEQLRAATARLDSAFKTQATQLGFNQNEVKKYAQSFKDAKVAIDNVPRNITATLSVRTDPATLALREWLAKNKNNTVNVTPKMGSAGNVKGGTANFDRIAVGGGGLSTPSLKAGSYASAPRLNISGAVTASSVKAGKTIGFSRGGSVPSYLASGGVPGLHPGEPRGTDTIPAWLSPGEYVQQKSAVDYYGRGTMDAMNQRQIPRTFFQAAMAAPKASSARSAQSSVVDLSAGSIQALARAVQPYLVVQDKVIAGANDKYATNATAFGS